jgi:hypothetical protein
METFQKALGATLFVTFCPLIFFRLLRNRQGSTGSSQLRTRFWTKGLMFIERYRTERTAVGLLVLVGLMMMPRLGFAAGASEAEDLRAIKSEIGKLEQDRLRDLDEIQKLKERVQQLEGENKQLKATSNEIQTEQTQTTQVVKQIQEQSKEGPSLNQFSSVFSRYLGTSTFMVTGAAGLSYIYDQQPGSINDIPHQRQNTFLSDWEPMILYRPNDWILFKGILSAAFGSTGTKVDLSSAEFHLFLHDHLEVVGGLFDNPFGDWYETQSPLWVNRFITAPLPFGVNAVVPAAEMGLQARGGFQWGELGQDWDYTVWGGNGPSFSEPVPGATMTAPTPIAFAATNSKSVGARFRIYPIPLEADWGRLELGASTYNGKWSGGKWLNSWGLDFNYFIGNLQTRGEWLQSYRQMPSGVPTDNRQGGYLQFGYFLNDANLPFLPDGVNRQLQRLEPLIRFSMVNQSAVASGDIEGATGVGMGGFRVGLVPDFGISRSPGLYAPHSREVALGLNYWIAPSIVWKNEFDFEVPRTGGAFIAADGSATPVGHAPKDYVFLTQFSIGF